MMRFEYDQKFIKLLAKEMVKEMQKVKDEATMLSEKPSNAYQMNCASGACTNSLSVETTNFASRACKNEKLGKFSSKLV